MTTPPWHPYRLVQPKDRPDYDDLVDGIASASWPEFMLNDPIAGRHWDDLFDRFADFQFALLAPDEDIVVGMGNSVPLAWAKPLTELPEAGWDWALAQAVEDHTAGRTPTIQCALQIAPAAGPAGPRHQPTDGAGHAHHRRQPRLQPVDRAGAPQRQKPLSPDIDRSLCRMDHRGGTTL
ncbi:MAG: hypothetical protein V9H69_12120 [Anaerolineae bacterium]